MKTPIKPRQTCPGEPGHHFTPDPLLVRLRRQGIGWEPDDLVNTMTLIRSALKMGDIEGANDNLLIFHDQAIAFADESEAEVTRIERENDGDLD